MSFNDLTAGLDLSSNAEAKSKKCLPQQVSSSAAQTTGSVTAVVDSPSKTSSEEVSVASPSGISIRTSTTVDLKTMAANNFEDDFPDVDMDMPVGDLGRESLKLLTDYLRPPKVNAKDWQDMAEEMGFSYQRDIQNFKLESNPVESVIFAWGTKRASTIGRLLEILRNIERDDVLQRLPSLLANDCRRWRRRQEEANEPVQVPEVSGNYPVQLATEELRGITVGDHPSRPPEVFDAYVCFTNADLEFVQELQKQLESPPHNFKLCIDFRDLVPGGSYATNTAEIIQNRCKKMIVILSPEFMQSSSQDFQMKFAVSLDQGSRAKRIIPVVVKPCTRPSIIRHIHACDFTKKDMHPWLWDGLRKAISLP